MGVGGQPHTPVTLPLGNTWCPLYMRLGGPQSQSGQVQKISPPTRIRFPDHPARGESLFFMLQNQMVMRALWLTVHFNEQIGQREVG
jgi:hypothetical protein